MKQVIICKDKIPPNSKIVQFYSCRFGKYIPYLLSNKNVYLLEKMGMKECSFLLNNQFIDGSYFVVSKVDPYFILLEKLRRIWPTGDGMERERMDIISSDFEISTLFVDLDFGLFCSVSDDDWVKLSFEKVKEFIVKKVRNLELALKNHSQFMEEIKKDNLLVSEADLGSEILKTAFELIAEHVHVDLMKLCCTELGVSPSLLLPDKRIMQNSLKRSRTTVVTQDSTQPKKKRKKVDLKATKSMSVKRLEKVNTKNNRKIFDFFKKK